MILEYKTTYTDDRGTEITKFITDGQSMKIMLRGHLFEGHFWELTPVDYNGVVASKFDFRTIEYLNGSIGYELAEFSVKVEMPIIVVTKKGTEEPAIIKLTSKPSRKELVIGGKKIPFEKPNFEYGLLPRNSKSFGLSHVKCCINCRYAEYSPYGGADYGDLMCFKNCKEAWLNTGYEDLKNPEGWDQVKEWLRTQEAFWCDEFDLKPDHLSDSIR